MHIIIPGVYSVLVVRNLQDNLIQDLIQRVRKYFVIFIATDYYLNNFFGFEFNRCATIVDYAHAM